MNYSKQLIFLLFGLMLTQVSFAEPNLQTLLAASDRARAGNLPGLVWNVRVINTGSAVLDLEPSELHLKVASNASLAEYLEPLRSKGSRILQIDRKMWFTKPGLRKPVAISPRQRLTGQASIGDIAATDYAHDYQASYLGINSINDEPCHVLNLVSIRDSSTYGHIIYWISVKRKVAIHAEFLSISGKKLKIADFIYNNQIHVNGTKALFISKMTIADVLTDAVTILEYSKVKVVKVNPSDLDLANLR